MTETTKTSKECEEAIKQFAEITKTDEALAHSILQDVDYNLEEAIGKYYMENPAEPLPDFIINEVLEAREQDGKKKDKTRKRALEDDEEAANQAGTSKQSEEPSAGAKKPRTEDDDELEVLKAEGDEAVPRPPHLQARLNEIPPDITVMSYNVDGLDDVCLPALPLRRRSSRGR
ncbi:5'-tyrosyl-DNA phosphodiesterase [Aphelenchoides fujianensis]|nr:5'-tyrosyl-DNA phosphodiesterase [Aphelenchoides fujianensis]